MANNYSKDALINQSHQTEIYYSTSFIRFLQKNAGANKIARLLLSNYDNCFKPAYRFMFTTSEVNYLTFRNDGTISYLPNGKEHIITDDKSWSKTGRQNGKPSKVIRKLFTPSALLLLKDSDFESFTNKYKSAFTDDGFRFEILPAEKIPSIYRTSSSNRMTGDTSLNDSCMNNEDSNFFDIYKHCKQLRIVVLYNKENKLGGRALLWSLKDDDGNEITLMDRLYVAQDFMYELFIEYAKENNFWYKVKYNSRANAAYFIKSNGESCTKYFKVYTDTNHDAYPYIDTFQYGGNGFISNDSDDSCYEYDQTDGTRSGDDRDDDDDDNGMVWDEIDETDIDYSESVTIDRGQKRGMLTHRDNAEEVNGYYWWKEDRDIMYISGQGYCHIDDTVYCERDSESYHVDDCVKTHDDEWILENESITVNGNVYHEDDDNIIEINSTWYEKDSDDVCEHEGEYYHRSDDNVVETYFGTLTHKSNVVTALHDDGDKNFFLPDDDDVHCIDGKYYHSSYKGLYFTNGEYQLRQLSLPLKFTRKYVKRNVAAA